ncbi:MAG: Histidinol-phosphate aminotransferase [Candidatus Gottesmanbacteria bacterium GW2011_GWC2_39_8]|uniref:histidinol-phosphate transaminase n=1 Tax=Candidatus Gottesmanbacteria bacterium GW2011_GWC2_39_8 TaxID=1618450 RepID=A0A0G0Q912_9BACT|nr:MAG: Histidinol-phosphate aminotransferase [Candidatus Gottesmanbacteria bacterium GW2011_GWC2_39_8]
MSDSDIINLEYTTIKTSLPDFIYQDLKEYVRNGNEYHHQPPELVNLLAAKNNIPAESIYLTAGSGESLFNLISTFGQNTVVFPPCFFDYGEVVKFGYKLNQVYSLTENGYQVKPTIFSEATLILLSIPNNPTGTVDKEAVREIVERNPQAVVVVDEAYSFFVKDTVIDWVEKYSNLVILRTFSKDFAMAGFRIGYMVINSRILKEYRKRMQWASVSYLSAGAAMSAINHEDYFRDLCNEIMVIKENFILFLKGNGFKILSSFTNSVLIKFETEAHADNFVKYLNENNIIVNQGNGNSVFGLDNSFVRIAIGTQEQMEIVKTVVEKTV